MASPPQLSVVMPVLNEVALVAATLQRLRAQAPQAEVIVVDGGSTDGTPEAATPHARVLWGMRGRAHQMNAGAAAASGDWLLFLHADTVLPDGFAKEVARAAALGYEAGAFPLRIDGRHPLLPLLAWGATLRTRWQGVALGDQALFCTAGRFAALGGFPPWPIMEDYGFALRLREAGVRLYLARRPAVTSGRRWDERGFWRTWWQFRMFYRRFHRTLRTEAEQASALARMRAEHRDVR